MSELLNSTTVLDLAGKGLGRVEMGIAAQLLHRNASLQVLKLSDNPIGQFGMEALAFAPSSQCPPFLSFIFSKWSVMHKWVRRMRSGL